MSRFNQCKECIKNDADYCRQKSWKIDYWQDTSECPSFEDGRDEDE